MYFRSGLMTTQGTVRETEAMEDKSEPEALAEAWMQQKLEGGEETK